MTTPLICGSIVKDNKVDSVWSERSQKITNLSFNRKLRMMRADVFSLYCCSMNSDFIKKPSVTHALKKSILKFLEGEFNFRVR